MKKYLEEQRSQLKHTRYMAVLSLFTAFCLFYVHEGSDGFGGSSWAFLVTALCAIIHLVKYASQDAHFRTVQAIVNNELSNKIQAEQEASHSTADHR